MAPSDISDVYFRVMYGSSFLRRQHRYATMATIKKITMVPPTMIQTRAPFDFGTWSAGEPMFPSVVSFLVVFWWVWLSGLVVLCSAGVVPLVFEDSFLSDSFLGGGGGGGGGGCSCC